MTPIDTTPASRITNPLQGSRAALTIAMFCEAYGVCRNTVYREIREGRLVAKKSGKKTLIPKTEADAWLGRLPDLKVKRVGRIM